MWVTQNMVSLYGYQTRRLVCNALVIHCLLLVCKKQIILFYFHSHLEIILPLSSLLTPLRLWGWARAPKPWQGSQAGLGVWATTTSKLSLHHVPKVIGMELMYVTAWGVIQRTRVVVDQLSRLDATWRPVYILVGQTFDLHGNVCTFLLSLSLFFFFSPF